MILMPHGVQGTPHFITLTRTLWTRQNFKGHYNKVKSRSYYVVAYLHPLTKVPSKYQFLTPYGLRDIALTRFSSLRSIEQGQRSNHGPTMTLHT